MKILSLQGHFGNLSGRKIEFSEGFCRSVLPNGWGKTTLFSLIRIMLYGLNTAKPDTAAQLSDKTRYMPRDGKAMSGRMVVQHEGRNIVIERTTGKNGPMQDFRAYYEDSHEDCTLFDGNTCGQALTGLSEDAFLSSMMIDGSMMQRPSAELREHISALTQTGDVQGQAMQAEHLLQTWKRKLGREQEQGLLAQLEKAKAALDSKADKQAEIARALTLQTAENARLEQEVAEAHADYERIYRMYAGGIASEEEHLEASLAESKRMIAHLETCTPPEDVIRTATEALYGYEGAVQLEREKRELLPQQNTRLDEAMKALEEDRRLDEAARNEAAKPRVRWWSLLIALLFAVASAATVIFQIDWGVITPYAHYILSGLALLAVIIAFAGSVRKTVPPKRDYDAERAELEKEQMKEQSAQQTAAAILQDAYDSLMTAARAIDPTITTIEQATMRVRDAQEDLQQLRRERGAQLELEEKQKKLRLGQAQPSEQGKQVEQAREILEDLQRQLDQGRQNVARLRGQAAALDGDQDKVSRESLEQAQKRAQQQLDAVELALSVLQEEQNALTERISPQITEMTRQYLEEMTNGAFLQVRLDNRLDACCAGKDGVFLNALQLSTGTRDQLYFALRLAVCNVLGGESKTAPILLDDPFLTFDDDRAGRALTLLRRLAQKRQIILLTCRSTMESAS